MGGYTWRSRTIGHQRQFGGKPCVGDVTESKTCNQEVPCRGEKKYYRSLYQGDQEGRPGVDCVWNEWNDWASCSRTRDGGYSWRSRTIGNQRQFGGKPCVGDLTESKTCNQEVPCRGEKQYYRSLNQGDQDSRPGQGGVDCIWNEWNDWASCSRTCDGGYSWRSRTIGHQRQFGGKPCVGDLTESKTCNQEVPCRGEKQYYRSLY